MFPGPASNEQTLSRLAEIAEVVSRQNHAVTLARSISAGDNGLKHNLGVRPGAQVGAVASALENGLKRNPTVRPGVQVGAVASALRKRPVERSSFSLPVVPVPAPKRAKVDAPPSSPSRSHHSGDEDDESEDLKDVRFREYQAEIWSEKFEDLCEFRRQYGHCHVPHTFTENAPLAQWVKRQRYQYKLKAEGKRSTLSDERVRLLNNIGFIWNSHDVVWEERWNELLAFKRVHGHCIVPSNYEPNAQLAVWVKRQRRQYKFYQENKATSMTPERIEKLNTLGFAWDCRKNNNGTSDEGDGNEGEIPLASTISTTAAPPKATVPSTPALALQPVNSPALQVTNIPRNGRGFPLPKAAWATAVIGKNIIPAITNGGNTVSAFKQQQYQGSAKTTPVPQPARASATPKAPTQEAATTLPANLPCEFFSFSRKFTKFPSIKLPNKI